MRNLFIGFILFSLLSCESRIENSEKDDFFNFISLKSDLIDSIGFTFYDKKQIIYQNDSTFIIYPDGHHLVFYHFESRSKVKRIKFTVPVENMTAFSVSSTTDLAIYYGEAIIRFKDGQETIIEIGKPPEYLYWRDDIYGFEYFPAQNMVVFGLSGAKWPGEDNLDFFLQGLCAFDLEEKGIVRLPHKFSEIYRNAEFWGGELYTSRKGDTLVVSENWSEMVYLIDMNTFEMSEFEVRHEDESLNEDLPVNLDEYPKFQPQKGKQKTEKYALWELRHFYFEKYYKAFLNTNGSYIYRFYNHRIPIASGTPIASKNQSAKSVVRYNLNSKITESFLLPADRFYVPGSFWLRENDFFEHIKFVYTKEYDPDSAIYLLDRIQLFSQER